MPEGQQPTADGSYDQELGYGDRYEAEKGIDARTQAERSVHPADSGPRPDTDTFVAAAAIMFMVAAHLRRWSRADREW